MSEALVGLRPTRYTYNIYLPNFLQASRDANQGTCVDSNDETVVESDISLSYDEVKNRHTYKLSGYIIIVRV